MSFSKMIELLQKNDKYTQAVADLYKKEYT